MSLDRDEIIKPLADNQMDNLVGLIQSVPLSLENEKIMQRELQSVLDSKFDGTVLSEFQLSKLDRVDFYLAPQGIAIECKRDRDASPRSIYRQLSRYAESPLVAGIVLVTWKSMALPETINKKPARVIQCARAWL